MLSAIFTFLTGVGILLFGVKYMGQSFEKLVGANFRKKLNKFAGNRFSSFTFGNLLTFILQSSTATTAMFVGFAGAGIISLFQGIGLIIGCNVGTAASSFILIFDSFNVVEILAGFVFIGLMVKIFAKSNELVKNIGDALIGFGILFAGLILISSATAVFKTIDGFENFILAFTNPALLIFVGTIVSMLLQSSCGTLAIIIPLLATSSSAGMSLVSATYLIIGLNLGACFTPIIISLSTNTDGKRVAWFHLIFNVIGAIIFTLLTLLTPWVDWLGGLVKDPAIFVLLVNLIFNLLTAMITLPLAKPLCSLMKILVKRSKKEIESPYTIRTTELDSPNIAMKKLNFQLKKLLEQYSTCFDSLRDYVLVNDTKVPKNLNKKIAKLKENADIIYSNSIRISGLITHNDQKTIIFVHETINNFRDIYENYSLIVGNMFLNDKKISFGSRRKEKLSSAFDKIKVMYNLTSEIFENLYDENSSYDCASTVQKILDLSNELSSFKMEDKRYVVSSLAQKNQVTNYSNTMNIINEIADLKNSLTDMSVNSLGFFDTKVQTQEISEKQENQAKESV